ncbi:MAG: hypothetical protein IT204_25270 [Fimbriimonadaceae bacterium]|nr:hypothetical protein [Fimbriimonadaceae bacterium]
MEKVVLAVVGGGLTLFGGLMFPYFVGQLLSGTSKNSPGINASLTVVFGAMLLAGLYLVWRSIRSVKLDGNGATRPGAAPTTTAAGRPGPPPPPSAPPQRPTTEEARERAVLRLAEQEHGRVTVPEVAARCDLTIAEAKAALDRMVQLQAAHMQVTPSGGLVYVFPGFMSDEEKARATDF